MLLVPDTSTKKGSQRKVASSRPPWGRGALPLWEKEPPMSVNCRAGCCLPRPGASCGCQVALCCPWTDTGQRLHLASLASGWLGRAGTGRGLSNLIWG